MTYDKTITRLPQIALDTEGSKPVTVNLFIPPSRMKFIIEVQVGFKIVKIECSDYLGATDIYDNMANCQRMIDQQVVDAFKTLMDK